MRCDNCGKKKTLQEVLGDKDDLGPVAWCDKCIQNSDAVDIQPVKEDGKLMVIDTEEVEGYGDYSVKYVDSEDEVGRNQSIMEEVNIVNRDKLENQIKASED